MSLRGPSECFCGCGRRVKGLTRRGLNAAGRDALLVIGRLNYAEEVARERGKGDLERRTEAFAVVREEGERQIAILTAVTHGERPPVPLGDFKLWLKNARGFTSFALLDPELQAMLSHGASVQELEEGQARLA